MREMVFGTILVAAAGLGVYFMPLTSGGEKPAYAMSMGEAKKLLAAADLREGKLPFGRLDVLVTAPAPNVVRYEAGGSFASLDCRAEFTPVGDAGVNVATSCNRSSPSDGAASSMTSDVSELAFAEYVDAALDQRPFNEGKMTALSAGAAMRNLPKMQHEALKMQREISQMQADSEAERRHDTDWSSDEQVQDYDYAPDSSEW
ncbi:hypothetical protein SZ64_07670 [Erythrobacter sp. SG61-1L]|uniref:hypothetical protein n=1 Tax=Erythrobacter sp. SG61-1L TaxID=1603897 RepID=UPI0006C9165C|nr:hypothetical protein [Erythrobacter sp. SG61-1L]KPL68010.1 hypothetical protein SZ64_07670 [Erythrobacter sp. SG61-1L]